MAKTRSTEDTAPESQPEALAVDIQNDEFRGIGGSYVFDSATGKRQRVAGPDLNDQAASQQTETEGLTHEGQ